MNTSSKIAIAAAAVGAWLIAKGKKAISGIGAVRLDKMDLRDLVLLCNEIGDRLQTGVLQKDYPQYRYSIIDFYTDRFGGTYVSLHYDYKTGKITNWFGGEYAYDIHTKEQLERVVERELYRELKARYGEDFAEKHFEFLRKNGRIGKVDYSDFDGARIVAKNGTSGIEFNIYGGNGGYITVTAVYKGFGERYGMDWEFLSHIGEYKTLSGAIRAAKKYWDARGIDYNPKDFEKL